MQETITPPTEHLLQPKIHGSIHVAVVGSGMAGLVVAYLLQRDPQCRYTVTVFECVWHKVTRSVSPTNLSQGSKPSLDAASVDIGKIRIDLPMRAFTDGYYPQLQAMYDHLGVRYRRQNFRFVFAREQGPPRFEGDNAQYKAHFIHASDKPLPPQRPPGVSVIAYLCELMFIIASLAWFTLCGLMVSSPGPNETLDEYLRRVRLPRRVASHYLLPIMSAVSSCSHHDLLAFPAQDVMEYHRRISSQKDYVVCGGVAQVQKALTADLDIKTHSRVIRIEPRRSSPGSGSGAVQVVAVTKRADGQVRRVTQAFDAVVTAVPPDVAAALFQPARRQLSRIPVRKVETVVHAELVPKGLAGADAADAVDEVWLKTSGEEAGRDGWTEATHVHPNGIAVTSCSRSDSFWVPLARAVFTRTLRTVESRRVVREVFEEGGLPVAEGGGEKKAGWRNGDGGVWMVGAWCWDGMVLLEGAVVSAARVARALGVEIPWEEGGRGEGIER